MQVLWPIGGQWVAPAVARRRFPNNTGEECRSATRIGKRSAYYILLWEAPTYVIVQDTSYPSVVCGCDRGRRRYSVQGRITYSVLRSHWYCVLLRTSTAEAGSIYHDPPRANFAQDQRPASSVTRWLSCYIWSHVKQYPCDPSGVNNFDRRSVRLFGFRLKHPSCRCPLLSELANAQPQLSSCIWRERKREKSHPLWGILRMPSACPE
jgi:hypothetical protein